MSEWLHYAGPVSISGMIIALCFLMWINWRGRAGGIFAGAIEARLQAKRYDDEDYAKQQETMMSLIDVTGNRTLHNGSVYGMRKVYEIVTDALLDEMCSVAGTGEVEKTGRQVTERRIYHVIAKSEDMARALFAEQHSTYFGRFPLVSIKPLCVIDGEITTENS